MLTKTPKRKKCSICSTEFDTYNSCQKYCSYACSNQAIKNKSSKKRLAQEVRNINSFNKKHGTKHGKMQLKCANCKKDYERYASHVKFRGSSYCSNECKHAGKIKSKTKAQLTKNLDAVYSKYIRNKYAVDGMVKCVTCGKQDEIRHMQNGHYVSRVYRSTRWLDTNCHPQCYRCNVGLSGNYAEYTLFMINTYGSGIIEELVVLSRKTPKYSKLDLQEKIDYYTKQLESYETNNKL